MKRDSHHGTWGWVGLGAGVLAFDILAPETLSNAFKRGRENSYARPFVLGGLALTAAHLLDLIPERYDPFDNLTKRVGDMVLGMRGVVAADQFDVFDE